MTVLLLDLNQESEAVLAEHAEFAFAMVISFIDYISNKVLDILELLKLLGQKFSLDINNLNGV